MNQDDDAARAEDYEKVRRTSPFTTGHKLARVLWYWVWGALGRHSPKPFRFWRIWLLRLFGAKVASTANVYPKAIIWAPWQIEVGEYSAIADGAVLYSQGKIIIGNSALISQDAYLCGGTHDYTSRAFGLISKNIVIGDHCWIAAKAFVHPGVTVGEGSIVGACSVVVKDIPPWQIWAGNPCIFLKGRVLK